MEVASLEQKVRQLPFDAQREVSDYVDFLLHKYRFQEQGVRLAQSYVADKAVQEEYMTNTDFWKEADKRIIKVCEQYGILQ